MKKEHRYAGEAMIKDDICRLSAHRPLNNRYFDVIPDGYDAKKRQYVFEVRFYQRVNGRPFKSSYERAELRFGAFVKNPIGASVAAFDKIVDDLRFDCPVVRK